MDITFIFHFNRGDFLKNCVDSVRRHTAAPIIIIDDNSTDPKSLELLAELSKEYEVVVPTQTEAEVRTGGLYPNINHAMEIARDRGAEWSLMIQDDQQMVRDLSETDRQALNAAAAQDDACGIVYACFPKQKRGKRTYGQSYEQLASGILKYTEHHTGLTSFSAVGFYNTRLFFEKSGPLGVGEGNNETRLNALGLKMYCMQTPVLHWLPLPIAFRSKVRRWQVRLTDWIAGSGVYPINDLTPAEVTAIAARTPDDPPYAEDVLTAPNLPPVLYWSLHGGRQNLRSRGGWRQTLMHLLPR